MTYTLGFYWNTSRTEPISPNIVENLTKKFLMAEIMSVNTIEETKFLLKWRVMGECSFWQVGF